MALADICGFKPATGHLGSSLEQDTEDYCGNFSANSTISLPPFANPGSNLGRFVLISNTVHFFKFFFISEY